MKILNRYHVKDARHLDRLLNGRNASVDLTITSPPYWNVRDYGSSRQIGFGQSYEKYLDDIEAVFRLVYLATKRTGSLWVISDTVKTDGELRLLPFDIAARLRRIGWHLQDIIIWQKDRTLPWSHQGKLRNIFEYVAFYSKSRRFKYHVDRVRDPSDAKLYWVRYPERYNPSGKAPSRTWHMPIPRQGSWGKAANFVRHACPLPVALIDRILRLTTDEGDLVLDPFAGSGAVLATAHSMKRRFVGLDLNTSYKRMFHDAVLPAVRALYRRDSVAPADTVLAHRAFSQTILALRALKFPKELLRLYRAEYGATKCQRVWVVPGRSSRRLLVLFEFPDSASIPDAFLERAASLASVPPLSKYQLSVTVKTASRIGTLRQVLTGHGLKEGSWIHEYAAGRFFKWSAKRRLSTVLETVPLQARPKGYPHLCSPIAVSIKTSRPQRPALS